LEFCASVGFIHKESVTMHGHTIVKLTDWFCVTEVESVFCAVRTESLYKTDKFRL